jgi:hypothetical protein
MVRQGDVLLIPVDEVPPESRRISHPDGRVTLAWGEATGHAHVVVGDRRVTLREFETDRYVILARNAELVHEEHAAIPLLSGAYRVVIQREYAPQTGALPGIGWQTVRD